MKCPYCGADKDRVVDSRSAAEGMEIRRRRECDGCKHRYTTYERVETIEMIVVKRDERRESFDREKVAKSIRIACQKRPVSEETIQELTNRIERRLFALPQRELSSSLIGEDVMHELSELDQVAYVRFSSVYRQFKDISQFIDELTLIMKKDNARKLENDQSSSYLPDDESPSGK